MKQTQRVVLMASMVFAAGLTGFSVFGENNMGFESEAFPMNESSDVLGHVVFTVRDADGNIKSYSQTDNVVTSAGKSCLVRLAFGSTAGCTTAPGTFDIIGLSETSYADNTTTADTALSAITQLTADLAPSTATVNAGTAGSGTATAAQGEVVHTFTWTQATTQTVTSAYLADTTGTTGNALAIKNLSPAVNLNENDTLEVTWQINIG